MSQTPTYSYWVVEVNHDTGEAQIDHDATNFWISRIFEPESNVMRFPENEDGYAERMTIEIDHDDLDSPYDFGRRILDKKLSKK